MPIFINREEMRTEPRDAGAGRGEEERPRLVLMSGGGFVPAPPEKMQEEVYEWNKAFDLGCAEFKEGLKTRDASRAAQGLEKLLSLYGLAFDLDPQAIKQPLPYNAAQVPAAGLAVLETVGRVAEAEVMKPCIGGLNTTTTRWAMLSIVCKPIEYFHDVTEANKSLCLGQIGTTVENALKRVDSLLGNAQLKRGLLAALAVRQDPMEEAKKTRAAHERLAAKVAAKATAEAPGQPSGPEVTQTTVTTSQPKSAPVTPPSPKSKEK